MGGGSWAVWCVCFVDFLAWTYGRGLQGLTRLLKILPFFICFSLALSLVSELVLVAVDLKFVSDSPRKNAPVHPCL